MTTNVLQTLIFISPWWLLKLFLAHVSDSLCCCAIIISWWESAAQPITGILTVLLHLAKWLFRAKIHIAFSHMKLLLTSKHSLNPTPVQSFKLRFTKSCWQHRAQVKQHFRANTFGLTSLIHEEKKRSQSQKMRFFWLCLLMSKFTCFVLTEWAVRLLSACIGFSHKMQPASYSLWIFAAAVSGKIQGKVRTRSTLEVI